MWEMNHFKSLSYSLSRGCFVVTLAYIHHFLMKTRTMILVSSMLLLGAILLPQRSQGEAI